MRDLKAFFSLAIPDSRNTEKCLGCCLEAPRANLPHPLSRDTFILLSNLQRSIEFTISWIQILGENVSVGCIHLTPQRLTWEFYQVDTPCIPFSMSLKDGCSALWGHSGSWLGHCPCLGLWFLCTFLLLQPFMVTCTGIGSLQPTQQEVQATTVECMFYSSLLCRLLVFLSIEWIFNRMKTYHANVGSYLQL